MTGFALLARIVAALLVLFAILQWNDPDPWLWMPIYLLPAGIGLIVAGRSLASKLLAWLCGGLAVTAGLAALLLFPGLPIADGEEIRESGGLFIVALWLAACTWIASQTPTA